MIQVNDALILDYLNDDLQTHSDEWYFNPPRYLAVPPGDDSTKRKIFSYLEAIRAHLEHFTPVNQPVMDKLFPLWKNEKLMLDLIAGFPNPYDAITEVAPDGKIHIVLDLFRLASYGLSPERISAVVSDMLTHEFIHVLILSQFPAIADDETGSDYVLAMNAITFNEGFAHLLSYMGKDLCAIDWGTQELKTVFDKSKSSLRSALAEKDRDRQVAMLEAANTGSFYDKFAAMSGMLYLAKRWKEDGIQGLKLELDLGYRDIVQRILQ
jgi:hypothetical protein